MSQWRKTSGYWVTRPREAEVLVGKAGRKSDLLYLIPPLPTISNKAQELVSGTSTGAGYAV